MSKSSGITRMLKVLGTAAVLAAALSQSAVAQTKGVKLYVDPLSYQYLDNTEIDYVESLHGAGFKFQNPNVKSTCGCGSSFSV